MNAPATLARHRSLVERALPWMAGVLALAAVLAGFLVEAGPARRFVVPYVAPLVFTFRLRIRDVQPRAVCEVRARICE